MARKNIEIDNELLNWFDTYHPGVSIWWLVNEFMRDLKEMSTNRRSELKKQIKQAARNANERMGE